MSLIGTYTYEEGTDGAAVGLGNGVVGVFGPPFYSATYAQHGSMGVYFPNATTPTIEYALTLPHTGSVYIKRGPETPTNRLNYIAFRDTFGSACGGIGIKKTGEWTLTDVNNNFLQVGTHISAPGDTFRIDWQVTYAASTLTWTARFFADPTSNTYTETLTTSAATTSPNRLGLTTFGGASCGMDTLRIWDDVSSWPNAYTYVPPSYTFTVWNGTSELAVSSVTVWDGTSEVSGTASVA